MPVITPIAPVLQKAAGLEPDDLYPIREVSRLTGVNPVTLRAWERRYGLIQPTRTESGHRLYSTADVERVRSILAWIDRGVAVSKVGKILAKAAPLQGLSHLFSGEQIQADHSQWQDQVRAAVRAFDKGELERVYGRIFSGYPLTVVFQDILLPVWRQLQQSQDVFGHTSEWLFLDGFLRARVNQRLSLTGAAFTRQVVVCALDARCLELELLVAASMLSHADCAIEVLALAQPFEELTLICERMAPHALVLFSSQVPAPELPRRLKRLAMSLDCQLLLAGEVAELAQDSLAGSSVGCLGNEGLEMRQRLKQFLAGSLDT